MHSSLRRRAWRFFGPTVRATLKKYDSKRRLVELSLITTKEGEDDTCLEYNDAGELVPVQTAAEEEASSKAARTV